jgi:hypothetical protein
MKLLLTSFGLANATRSGRTSTRRKIPGATADRIAALAEGPTFAIDDASAVVDGETVTVASEGSWRYFA